MQRFQSIVQQRGQVPFASYSGERVYMREFTKRQGLPIDLTRWQSTVDAMLDGVDADGPIYLMIDQGMVRAGSSQRRPGVHIDGYWIPSIQAHGGRHMTGVWDNGSGGRWKTCNFSHPEAIILASSVTAARAFAGEFDGAPSEGGDCAHINTTGLRETVLKSGFAYAGNVTMLHESLPVTADCLRTVVRLNVPGWSPL